MTRVWPGEVRCQDSQKKKIAAETENLHPSQKILAETPTRLAPKMILWRIPQSRIAGLRSRFQTVLKHLRYRFRMFSTRFPQRMRLWLSGRIPCRKYCFRLFRRSWLWPSRPDLNIRLPRKPPVSLMCLPWILPHCGRGGPHRNRGCHADARTRSASGTKEGHALQCHHFLI